MSESGTEPPDLLALTRPLGPRSIAITVDIYGHAIPNANRSAVERLAAASQPPASTALQNFDETSTAAGRAR